MGGARGAPRAPRQPTQPSKKIQPQAARVHSRARKARTAARRGVTVLATKRVPSMLHAGGTQAFAGRAAAPKGNGRAQMRSPAVQRHAPARQAVDQHHTRGSSAAGPATRSAPLGSQLRPGTKRGARHVAYATLDVEAIKAQSLQLDTFESSALQQVRSRAGASRRAHTAVSVRIAPDLLRVAPGRFDQVVVKSLLYILLPPAGGGPAETDAGRQRVRDRRHHPRVVPERSQAGSGEGGEEGSPTPDPSPHRAPLRPRKPHKCDPHRPASPGEGVPCLEGPGERQALLQGRAGGGCDGQGLPPLRPRRGAPPPGRTSPSAPRTIRSRSPQSRPATLHLRPWPTSFPVACRPHSHTQSPSLTPPTPRSSAAPSSASRWPSTASTTATSPRRSASASCSWTTRSGSSRRAASPARATPSARACGPGHRAPGQKGTRAAGGRQEACAEWRGAHWHTSAAETVVLVLPCRPRGTKRRPSW